jgi:hypothetical protein
MHRIKVGFFSISNHDESGDDRDYLSWHQLDHMPEQYSLPGLIFGQRWYSTPACKAARAVAADGWEGVGHVVCYLMGNPVQETLDEFLTLGRALAEMGRFSLHLDSTFLAGLRLLQAQAAPRTMISDDVIPFRPHKGAYVIVEQPAEPVDEAAQDDYLQRVHTEVLPTLVQVPGVAGAITYGTSPAIRRPTFTPGVFRITVCYLDEEPAEVGRSLAPVLEGLWRTSPVRPVLAAPFEPMMRWDWERFGPQG